MRQTDNMDYIYNVNKEKVSIDDLQKDTRIQVVESFMEYRKFKKMTQDKPSKCAGMSRTNITRFESGNYNPSLEMMVRIAAAMGAKLEINLVEK